MIVMVGGREQGNDCAQDVKIIINIFLISNIVWF